MPAPALSQCSKTLRSTQWNSLAVADDSQSVNLASLLTELRPEIYCWLGGRRKSDFEGRDSTRLSSLSVGPQGKALTLMDGDMISVGGTEFTSDDGTEANVCYGGT